MHTADRRNHRARTLTSRAVVLAALAVVALASAACAPAVGGSSPDYFAGGTYPLDIDVPSQTFSEDFSFFDANCTASATTPSLSIPGATLTLQAAELDPLTMRATIPGATLDLPAATLSAGSIGVSCDGAEVFRLGVSVTFDATASVQSAQLDLSAGTATLSDPTITITDATATVSGIAGLDPIALDPITLNVPSADVPVL